MVKDAYVGIDGLARKIKKGYVGVDGLARKIKKAYIGIGGIARPCWCDEELVYYGTASSLNEGREMLAATTVGNYALFAGGYKLSSDNHYSNSIDVYYKSLTKVTATNLSVARYDLAATTVGNYALFAGGHGDGFYDKSTVDAYDSSLTKVTSTNLSVARCKLAATTVGNYALFAGGINDDYEIDYENVYEMYKSTVDAYDSSLTRTTSTNLSVARSELAATTVGNYALFAGGKSKVDSVDAYTIK